jgi:hypothetical protein
MDPYCLLLMMYNIYTYHPVDEILSFSSHSKCSYLSNRSTCMLAYRLVSYGAAIAQVMVLMMNSDGGI